MLHLSPETEALIRAKAAADGVTPDELLRHALRPQTGAPTRQKPDIERMQAIARRTAALPVRDNRSSKEIADEGWGL